MAVAREAYFRDQTRIWQLIRLTQAIQARIPKVHHRRLVTLFKAHPEVIDTHQLTLSTAELGLLWRCPAAQVARVLHLMTRGSQGAMTYRIAEGSPGPGNLVQLTFTVPDAGQGGPKHG
jgi:hypothetical protein